MLVSVTDRSVAERTGSDARHRASTAPSPPPENLRTRLAFVPRGYRRAGAAVLLVLVVALFGAWVKLSSADEAPPPAAETTTSASAAPAPTVTTVPTTTASPEQDAARRSAFVQTMTARLGLTEAAANCVADKVAAEVGWTKLGANLLEGENPKILEGLMLNCVKPG
jgi:hypothetical protein